MEITEVQDRHSCIRVTVDAKYYVYIFGNNLYFEDISLIGNMKNLRAPRETQREVLDFVDKNKHSLYQYDWNTEEIEKWLEKYSQQKKKHKSEVNERKLEREKLKARDIEKNKNKRDKF